MTIESAIIILLAINVFIIFIGRKMIFKLARKLDKVLEELRKNNG